LWWRWLVFWDVAPCSLVEVYRRFRDSKHLWDAGKLLPDYTAQHPRRQSFSYLPPWEPDISPVSWCLLLEWRETSEVQHS
jgi:hypothetical protein